MSVSCGNLNQDRTAARTDLSSHDKYFLLLTVNTNWWYNDGMRLLLRMNIRCWGFRGARLMLRSPSFSLPAMSALVLIGERGTPRYCWTSVMSIAGIGCPKIHRWGCGLTIHIFLLPSTSICSKADLPSSPGKYWRPPDVLPISAISSAKAPATQLRI